MSVAAFTPVMGSSLGLGHPLDPLSALEIGRACELLIAIEEAGT
jgi:hypothetical protein